MNRSRIREGTAISLFPFLAVLLCTMGALLVLLVLFGYSANQQEEQAASEQARQQATELRLVAEDLKWRREQLYVMRQKTGGDLEALRLQLAGIEEHSRELADELKELQQLDARLAADTPTVVPNESELARLEARLMSARESLDEARRERDSRPPAYAVVPYEGDSGTHRRPLFIECSLDGVFLQPEGIRLNPDDFEGPSGPGNPLASALRAAREYLARQAIKKDDPGLRPYPLLLVRPSGVMAYYAAREAIASWGSDFGYQLIDEDWTIAFPKKDLALQDVEMQAIKEARERLLWLAQTRSAVRRSRPERQQFRASAVRGGIVANGGPTVLGDQSRWDWANQQAARQGIRSGDGSGSNAVIGGGEKTGSGVGHGSGRVAGSVGAASPAGRPLAAGTVSGGGGRGSAESGGRSMPGTALGNIASRGAAGAELVGNAAGPSGLASGANYSGSSTAAGQHGSQGLASGKHGETGQLSVEASAAGNAVGSQPAGTGEAGAGGESSGSGGLASFNASGSGGGGSDSLSTATGTGGGGGGMSGGPQVPLGISVGSPQAGSGSQQPERSGTGSARQAGQDCDSLAGVRGSDWASFATSQQYIPLTRPIQLECAGDEIRLLDDAGRRVVVRIPVFERTVDSVDSLVSAIRRRVDSWGIAGDRLYWKPELILSETSDGAGRMADLQQLLAGSGLPTRLKKQSDDVKRLPAVRSQRRQVSEGNSLRGAPEVRR